MKNDSKNRVYNLTRAEYPALFSFLFPEASLEYKITTLYIYEGVYKEVEPGFNELLLFSRVGSNWLVKNLSKNKRALADFALLRMRQGNGIKNY